MRECQRQDEDCVLDSLELQKHILIPQVSTRIQCLIGIMTHAIRLDKGSSAIFNNNRRSVDLTLQCVPLEMCGRHYVLDQTSQEGPPFLTAVSAIEQTG